MGVRMKRLFDIASLDDNQLINKKFVLDSNVLLRVFHLNASDKSKINIAYSEFVNKLFKISRRVIVRYEEIIAMFSAIEEISWRNYKALIDKTTSFDDYLYIPQERQSRKTLLCNIYGIINQLKVSDKIFIEESDNIDFNHFLENYNEFSGKNIRAYQLIKYCKDNDFPLVSENSFIKNCNTDICIYSLMSGRK